MTGDNRWGWKSVSDTIDASHADGRVESRPRPGSPRTRRNESSRIPGGLPTRAGVGESGWWSDTRFRTRRCSRIATIATVASAATAATDGEQTGPSSKGNFRKI